NRDREFQLWLRRLRPRVEDWRKASGDDDTLLRGAALVQAEEFLARRADELSEEEKTYIGACAEARHAREAAAKAEQQRRLRDAQQTAGGEKKAATAQKGLTRAAVAVVIVVGVVAAFAIFQSRQASRASSLAGVRQLAYQSRLNLEVRAPRNLLQALTFVAET